MPEMIKTAQQFLKAKVISAEPYGAGHINQTYKVVCSDGEKYILQKINDNVFPDVEGLMQNICNVTDFIAQKNPSNYVLKVIPTLSGRSYLQSDEGFFRMYNFLPGLTVENGATAAQFRLVGKGFGHFQQMLNGFPSEKLHETIKDFHNTPKRFEDFCRALKQDSHRRAEECSEEAEFFLSRKEYCGRVTDLLKNGKMPLRVTHNDTKSNNVLVDEIHNSVVAVIDLDTVMPGSILYDFGDSLRYGANTAAEDEVDLSKVSFSKEFYDAFCAGFIPEVKNSLTECEKENLYFGALIMTYECGMRFLTDYLCGDTYFRIHREKHNLDRCRTQIALLKDMENNLEYMKKTAKKYFD